jgi:hypothetical protein
MAVTSKLSKLVIDFRDGLYGGSKLVLGYCLCLYWTDYDHSARLKHLIIRTSVVVGSPTLILKRIDVPSLRP